MNISILSDILTVLLASQAYTFKYKLGLFSSNNGVRQKKQRYSMLILGHTGIDAADTLSEEGAQLKCMNSSVDHESDEITGSKLERYVKT